MPLDTTKVLVGHASIFTGPENTPLPDDDEGVGIDWDTPWVNVGATEEGVSFIVGTDTQDINIEEQSTPVAILVTRRNVRLTFVLSEDTIEHMKLAYGGGTLVTTAAASAVVGKKTLTLSDTLDRLAVGFEGLNPHGFFRRVYVPNVLSLADVTTRYRRAADNRQYAVELRAVCAANQIKVIDKTANALP